MSITKKHNPFRPNSPVPPGMFTGRLHEVERIADSFSRLRDGNPSHLMLVGERGIGKSSLLLFADKLASGNVQWDDEILPFNFIPVHFSLDKTLSPYGFIKKIKNGIERHLRKEEKILSLFQKGWDFIKRLEVGGVKINATEIDNQQLVDDFVYSLAETCKNFMEESYWTESNLKTHKEGIVLLIDETDNASSELDLGVLLKNLAEALQIADCNHVLFILSGLPRLREVLRDSHESSLRLFEELELLPLIEKDVKYIFEKGVSIVNDKNPEEKISISPEALDKMAFVSEGYPHFIQQIGSSTFDVNTEATITLETVDKAIFQKNGALDLIGDRYYRDMYYKKINEDSYREILNIMASNISAGNPSGVTSRKEIAEKMKGRTKWVDNGIHALKERGIILPVLGKKGQYKLQWMGFGVWIKFFTNKESDDKASATE